MGAATRRARRRAARAGRAVTLTLQEHPDTHNARLAVMLEDLWDRRSGAVYTLACALVGDEAAAGRAMRLGLADLTHTGDSDWADDAHRQWAHHVYLRSQQVGGSATADPEASKPTWLGHLAPIHRACVALCLFGGHTYRDVASLLDVPPERWPTC